MSFEPVMTLEELNRFLETDFPEIHTDGKVFEVISVAPGTVEMRLSPNARHLRPGGTISGPTMFALADVAAYCTVLVAIGPVALAVTTNLNINFLRRPEPGPLSCTCRLLKLGRRLAVVEASIFSGTDAELVAHATATYSIPPR